MYKCSPSHSHPGGQALFLETYLNPSVTWALARVIDNTGYVYVRTCRPSITTSGLFIIATGVSYMQSSGWAPYHLVLINSLCREGRGGVTLA